MASEANAESAKGRGAKLAKGCGCTVGLAALALGILVIGGFDRGAWASAIIGIAIAVLVFRVSGTNGSWEG